MGSTIGTGSTIGMGFTMRRGSTMRKLSTMSSKVFSSPKRASTKVFLTEKEDKKKVN